MFYWMRSLQTYDNGWNYMDNLKSFVRGGMVDETFIDSVSGIVNRVSFGSRKYTYVKDTEHLLTASSIEQSLPYNT